MQRLEVSGAVRLIYGSLGIKRLITHHHILQRCINTLCGPEAKAHFEHKIQPMREDGQVSKVMLVIKSTL